MLKSMGKNKKYIWQVITIGLFGIAGVLLGCVIMCVIKYQIVIPNCSGGSDGFSLLFLFLQVYMDFCLRGNGIWVLS